MLKFELYFATNDRAPFKKIEDIISSMFECFTISDQIGYWRGDKEKSYCLTVFDTSDRSDQFKIIADCIKSLYRQEAVLFVKSQVQGEII
jgi:hypothetical protein